MCKLICSLTTPTGADVLCGSSDLAVLLCSGVWGLLSLVGLIAWCRWEGVHSSARDEPIAKPPELLGTYSDFHDASAEEASESYGKLTADTAPDAN